MTEQSGPGWAKFTATDTPEDVERKMHAAFAPLRLAMEAMAIYCGPVDTSSPDCTCAEECPDPDCIVHPEPNRV